MSDEIHNWLKRRPVPVRVRVETISGEVKTVQAPPNRRLRNWADTIESLEPLALEALDAQENILRTLKVAELVEGSPPFDPAAPPTPLAMPAVLAQDPNAALLGFFGDLLFRSCAAQNHAFSRLCDLLERSEARSNQIEERLERTEAAYRAELMANMKNMAQGNAEGEGGGDAIIQAFMSGAQSRRNGASSPFGGNGKGWGFSPQAESDEVD